MTLTKKYKSELTQVFGITRRVINILARDGRREIITKLNDSEM